MIIRPPSTYQLESLHFQIPHQFQSGRESEVTDEELSKLKDVEVRIEILKPYCVLVISLSGYRVLDDLVNVTNLTLSDSNNR